MRWGTMINDIQEADRSPIGKNLIPLSKLGFDSSDNGDTKGEERCSDLYLCLFFVLHLYFDLFIVKWYI